MDTREVEIAPAADLGLCDALQRETLQLQSC